VAGELPVITEASEALCYSSGSWTTSHGVQGNDEAIRLSVTCLVAGGHLLWRTCPAWADEPRQGPVGLGVLRHRRIQFTSDLLPSDVTGVSVFDATKTTFEFRPGPSSPTSSLVTRSTARLRRLSQRCSSRWRSAGHCRRNTYKLPDPFMVIATQTRSSTRDVSAPHQSARPVPS